MASDQCICPGDEPVCPKCGRRWEYVSNWPDGSKSYCSKLVRDKFAIIYGEKAAEFMVPVVDPETAGTRVFAHAVDLVTGGGR